MDREKLRLAKDWAMHEIVSSLLNGWTVEFQPMNGGYLQVRVSKSGKHAYRCIPISTDEQFYLNIWEAVNTLRQDIMEEFPYVGT